MRRQPKIKMLCGFKPYLSLAGAVFWCLVLGFSGMAFSLDAGISGDAQKVVVVDPGHGGNDEGVKSPEGLLEKRVNLALAEKLKEELSEKYAVVLTRTADYDVSPAQRASIANNRQGELFISLHTGGGFRRLTDRWSIYYYRLQSEDKQAGPEESKRNSGTVPWHRVQLRHSGSSALLAEKLEDRLSGSHIMARPELIGAPLAVLKGLDMPAVVVEYGYLTHPQTAASLAEESYLDTLAAILAAGVSDFFADGPAGK